MATPLRRAAGLIDPQGRALEADVQLRRKRLPSDDSALVARTQDAFPRQLRSWGGGYCPPVHGDARAVVRRSPGTATGAPLRPQILVVQPR